MKEKLSKDKCYAVSQKVIDLYCLFFKRWLCISDPKYTPVPWNTISHQYDIKTIMKHVSGNYAVGVYAGKNATKFVSIDIDEGDPEIVRRVIDTLVEIGIPRDRLYVSFSGKKGYHVDFFVEKTIYNSYARLIYETMIERSGLDRRKVEFRPTHSQAIKLPLGVHPITKKRCWYVDRDTLESIESFDYIFEIKAIDHDLIEGIAKGLKNEYIRKMYSEVNSHQERVLKPRASNCDSLVVTAPGTRHNLQKRVAVSARKCGCDWEEIVQRQMEWYKRQNQAYITSSEDEVRAEAERLAKWAIDNVAIEAVQSVSKNEAIVCLNKRCLPYILGAPTKSTRLVLFLLCIYCSKYGEAKISYGTIAEHTGISPESVKNAIKWLGGNGFIHVEHSTNRYNNIVVLKSANKYRFPGDRKLVSPRKMHLRSECYEVREWPTADNCYGMYIDMLSSMCTLEYLGKFLTKPELKACKERVEASVRESADNDADGDT